ncbi:brachyurin-like [Calliphora vicina]|uniref:brachyurin-like n=1 Tax=Calliphora vicina TaxID=7373 RepID=UPI00325BA9A9
MKTCCLYQLVVILVICSTLFITHVQTKAIEGRIISGTAAAPNQFPYHVILKKDEYDSVRCGGSIISDSWVLTAAHCTSGFTSMLLVFGTIELANDAINMTATQFFIHPQYNATNLNNDVSLIQLPTPLTFTSSIQPITLVTSLQAANGFIGDQATITGFGLMDDEYLDYSEVLLFAQVQIVKNSVCSIEFGNDVVKDSTLCAKGANGSNMSICSGDSGGALVWQNVDGSYVQIGINSFVAEDQCTDSLPSGYVRLSSYLTFISSVSGINVS